MSRLANPKSNPKSRQTRMRARLAIASLAAASLAALISAQDHASAASGRSHRPVASVESIESRPAGEPIMAIVSLRNQRITVYDVKGWILRAPVSSGQKGRETPAGVFTVLQKNEDHWSNLYDDGHMPHMQRLTWSGIALHGGSLPGYPASHGCVRLPFDFAARLFETTRLGMRVVVAPGDVAPIEIAHPALLRSRPGAAAIAAARASEAQAADMKADQARLAVLMASREVARATVAVRVAENLRRMAESQLARAEAVLASSISAEAKEQAESAKAQAVARIAELQAQAAAAKAELQPKLDAVAPARAAMVAAEAARVAAAEAAREAAREFEPVSVFISRQSQRLYVRRAFQPILEFPVTIADADRPIGTHVFTAIELTGGADLRWNVVSLGNGRPQRGAVAPTARTGGDRHIEPRPAGPDAKAALDRIVIPQDALDLLAGMASPGSSLIISDEGLTSETGKDTEFVVILGDEPQGSMKRRVPRARFAGP
jgi:lipoprotein-anchoring transpeptidase ErfK/SrfK